MSKLPVLKPKDVIRRLEKFGFQEDHQTGSHVVLFHPVTRKRAVVAFHLHDIPKGTLSALLREARISREEFLDQN